MQVHYLDSAKREKTTTVSLDDYASFGALLGDLHSSLDVSEDFHEFLAGLWVADPDMLGTYLQAKYWNSLPPKVRDSVDFLLDSHHYFEKIRTLEDAARYERVLGKSEVVYCVDDDAFIRVFKRSYGYLLSYTAVFAPAYDKYPAKWDALGDRPLPPNFSSVPYAQALRAKRPLVRGDAETLEAFIRWADVPGKLTLEPNAAEFRTAVLNALQWHYLVASNVATKGDTLLIRQSGQRLAAANMESIVDTLKDVVDFNIAEDGDLDDKSDQTPYDPKRNDNEAFGEEYEEGEQEDYTDLDADFDWEHYDEMRTSPRNWPVHDHSILWGPAAINRYNVDYYMNVASVEKHATPTETRVLISRGKLNRTVDVIIRAGFSADEDMPYFLDYQLTDTATGKPATFNYAGKAYLSTEGGKTYLVIGNPATQANLDEYIVADEPTADSLAQVEAAERGVTAAFGPKVPRAPRNADYETMRAYRDALEMRKAGKFRWLPDLT